MSKRKNPSSKEGQEIVNLLTNKGNQANANTIDPPPNVKETNAVDQANAKNNSSISNPNDQAHAKNVSNDTEESPNKDDSSNQQGTSKSIEVDKEIGNDDAVNKNNKIEKGKGTILIDDSYKELLGSKPKANATENLTPSIIVTQQMKDLDMTMDRATAAVLAGNKEEAAFLFRIHEQMKSADIRSKSPVHSSSLNSLTLIKSQKDQIEGKSLKSNPIILIDEVNQDKAPLIVDGEEIKVVENGFTFCEGASTSTDSNIGLTPFFEKNIKELRLPVPLTIFNEEWQEEAWQYHAEKKVKSDESTKAQNIYSGLPYPHEFSQSYMTWTINYRNFIKAIRYKFKFVKLAEWIEKHKENVENIRETECWMVAFRYDLRMRTLLFTEKVTYEDGTTGPIDISKCRLDLKEICFAKARKCDELSFRDNPYAEGGERFDWDHNTGNPKTRQNLSRNTSFNSNQSNSSQRSYNNNNHLNSNQFNSQPNNFSSTYQKQQTDGKKRKGYLGGNFDPNFVRKGKQAESSTNVNKT